MTTVKTDGKVGPKVEHPTVAERAALGKAARAKLPRSSHGEWAPATDRPDPVALLEAQEATRVPELVPLRHERMAASPFAFYRGAANVLAADLAADHAPGLNVQLCGDAHLANFGGFASPERHLVFDMNDFDETLPGPFEWDVKRLAASLEIAARAVGSTARSGPASSARRCESYRHSMRSFAEMENLDVWYARLTADDIIAGGAATWPRATLKAFQRSVDKAGVEGQPEGAGSKLTQHRRRRAAVRQRPAAAGSDRELFPESARPRVRGVDPRGPADYRHTLQDDRRHLLESYRFVDLARKVVGVGSVGTRCWVALLVGRDNDDPLFLQVKEAEASVLEPYLGTSGFANHGQRVVEGQRLMQAASDIFLGWERVDRLSTAGTTTTTCASCGTGRRRPTSTRWRPTGSTIYGQICGWTLARAHARTGDRVAIAAYLGSSASFDEALARFAGLYAEQNDLDHQALATAIATGRMTAENEA